MDKVRPVFNYFSNALCEAVIRSLPVSKPVSMLAGDNVLWRLINGHWIGKRSVWTFDNRACWLEDLGNDAVKVWWCGGPDADYSECFYRD